MVTSVLTLGLAPWMVGLATVGFLLICLLLVLIVLIQRPQGGGLSGAFGAGGGAGSGQTAFGAKTGDALTIATVSVFVLFLVGAVLLNFAIRPSEEGEPAQQTASEQAPAGAGEAATTGSETDEASSEQTPPAADDAPANDSTPAQVEDAPPADDQPAEEVPADDGNGR